MEERIAKLELIINRLARRTVQTSKAIITPFPISNAAFGEDVRGPILRYMFPCAGTITKGMARLAVKPGTLTRLTVYSSGESGGASKEFVFEGKILTVVPDIPVKGGDCLEIDLISGEPLNEVWVSFLWVPIVDEITIKNYLIDELDELAAKNKLIGG